MACDSATPFNRIRVECKCIAYNMQLSIHILVSFAAPKPVMLTSLHSAHQENRIPLCTQRSPYIAFDPARHSTALDAHPRSLASTTCHDAFRSRTNPVTRAPSFVPVPRASLAHAIRRKVHTPNDLLHTPYKRLEGTQPILVLRTPVDARKRHCRVVEYEPDLFVRLGAETGGRAREDLELEVGPEGAEPASGEQESKS
jgi:hypothetical protein